MVTGNGERSVQGFCTGLHIEEARSRFGRCADRYQNPRRHLLSLAVFDPLNNAVLSWLCSRRRILEYYSWPPG